MPSQRPPQLRLLRDVSNEDIITRYPEARESEGDFAGSCATSRNAPLKLRARSSQHDLSRWSRREPSVRRAKIQRNNLARRPAFASRSDTV